MDTAPSIANSVQLAENSTILSEPTSLPCPAPELPDYHDSLTTPCHRPPASDILEELFRKVYLNQLALCYYPEVAVTCEGVPPELGEKQATQNVSSSEVAAGYNTKSERGALCYYPEVAVTCEGVPTELGEKQATQNVSSSEVAAGYNINSERGADTGECDVIEGNYCQKHKSKLIEQKVRVRKWKLCKSGTRNRTRNRLR